MFNFAQTPGATLANLRNSARSTSPAGKHWPGLALIRDHSVRHNHEIAQIASLYEAVPPKLYGGTERIVAHLADVFVELGNDVILFSSADARPKWAVKVQRLLAQCEHLPRALHLAKWAAYAYAAQAAAGFAIGLALPWVRL